MGYDGLDLSEDYHEDGWAGSKPQWVSPVNADYRIYLTSRLAGFTFDGSFVVGGSDEGKEHLPVDTRRTRTHANVARLTQVLALRSPTLKLGSTSTRSRRQGLALWWLGHRRDIALLTATWGFSGLWGLTLTGNKEPVLLLLEADSNSSE